MIFLGYVVGLTMMGLIWAGNDDKRLKELAEHERKYVEHIHGLELELKEKECADHWKAAAFSSMAVAGIAVVGPAVVAAVKEMR